jgi:hypothetical protein
MDRGLEIWAIGYLPFEHQPGLRLGTREQPEKENRVILKQTYVTWFFLLNDLTLGRLYEWIFAAFSGRIHLQMRFGFSLLAGGFVEDPHVEGQEWATEPPGMRKPAASYISAVPKKRQECEKCVAVGFG